VALAYPEPPLSDCVVLLRPWANDDLPLLVKASGDDYVAMIERIPVPFTDRAIGSPASTVASEPSRVGSSRSSRLTKPRRWVGSA
jgi:hypothetical protein